MQQSDANPLQRHINATIPVYPNKTVPLTFLAPRQIPPYPTAYTIPTTFTVPAIPSQYSCPSLGC